MSAAARTAAWASVIVLVVAGCGGAASRRRTTAGGSDLVPGAGEQRRPAGREVLGIPAVGRFYGRCAPDARRWMLRFVDDAGADDLLQYTVAGHSSRWIDVRPAASVTWQLRPGAARTPEPADPLTKSPATTVPSTSPLHIVISQGTEPHIYRVDVDVALAPALGDTADCALISTQLRGFTYFNGGAPAVS